MNVKNIKHQVEPLENTFSISCLAYMTLFLRKFLGEITIEKHLTLLAYDMG